MVGLFKQKTSVNIILGLIFGLVLKAPLFLFLKPLQVSQTDGKFYSNVIVPLFQVPNGATIASVVAFGLLYLQALLLNYLVNEYRLTPRHTFLPAMAYLIITSLLPEWNYLSAPLIANTFIIWAFIQLFKLYNNPKAKGVIYNIGLIIGLSAYIFFPAVVITLCLLIGIMTLRAFRLNELVLLVLGVVTPFYFYAAYLFLNDELSVKSLEVIINYKLPVIKNSIWLYINAALLMIPFLLGGFHVQAHLHKMLIQTRRYWSLMLLYLLLAIGIPFINTPSIFLNAALMLVPFAAFHASAYFYLRNWIALSLFFITIGVIFYEQYGTMLWQ